MEVFLIKTLQFLLAISLLVLLHELGHFGFAKLFKVRVNRFYLFFNPKFHIVSTYDSWVRRLLKKKPEVVPMVDQVVEVEKDGVKETKTIQVKDYVGTEYGLGWLPLGGYCDIDGMIDESKSELRKDPEKWEFRVKPAWQRLLIMAGGVLVNFVLALFIYSMILFAWGDTYLPVSKMAHGMEFNKEAKALGFQDGDVLQSTDKGDFKRYDADMFRMLVDAREVHVLRDGQPVTVTYPQGTELSLLDMIKQEPRFVREMIPALIDSVLPGTPAAELGLQKGDRLLRVNNQPVNSYYQFTDEILRLSDVMAAAKTADDSLRARQITLVYERDGVCDTISGQLTAELKLGFAPCIDTKPVTEEFGFLQSLPAGIGYGWHVLSSYVDDMKYVFTSEGAKSLGGFGAIGGLFPPTWDWHRFWLMTAFLSIILAFMNILPIPALDGGHIFFLLIEMLTGHKFSAKFMERAQYVGFTIIVLLMIVANLNDVLRWLGYM